MDLRSFLALLTLIGFLVTIWGLFSAWRGAKREYRAADVRIMHAKRLADEQSRMREEMGNDVWVMQTDEQKKAYWAHWDAEYRKYDLDRPTAGNLQHIAAYESRRLLGLLFDSTSRDLLIAAIGLFISTLASVGSLFVVS